MLIYVLLSIVRPGEGATKAATRGTKERNARRSIGTGNIASASRFFKMRKVVLVYISCFVVRVATFWMDRDVKWSRMSVARRRSVIHFRIQIHFSTREKKVTRRVGRVTFEFLTHNHRKMSRV